LANRKIHLIGGTLFWGAFLGIFYALERYTNLINLEITTLSGLEVHSVWIVLSFMACHFGAQLPDYDLLWDKFLPHRNVITHSFFLPLVISIPLFFIRNMGEVVFFLVPIYAFYHIGHASHLFLDLKPKSWEGTALVHIFWINDEGRKTMPPKVSRMFLLVNGLIILAAGIILLYFFNSWYVAP